MFETDGMFGHRLLRAFDDAVMPMRCAFCGTRIRDEERSVCADCHADLPWIGATQPIRPFCSVVAPLAYEFPVDAAIKALKFRRRLWYGPALGQLLSRSIDALPKDIDAVLPVPLHWRRRWRRGFNQAREIARPVARQLGVPLIGGVRRVRATRPQSGLSAGERRRNLLGAFVASGRCRARHPLIVDDVITTGATIAQLGRAVLDGGADKVSVLAVARAGY
jgi:ComF family protein